MPKRKRSTADLDITRGVMSVEFVSIESYDPSPAAALEDAALYLRAHPGKVLHQIRYERGGGVDGNKVKMLFLQDVIEETVWEHPSYS